MVEAKPALEQMFIRFDIDGILERDTDLFPNASEHLQQLKATLAGLDYSKVLALYPEMMNCDVPEDRLQGLSERDLAVYRQ